MAVHMWTHVTKKKYNRIRGVFMGELKGLQPLLQHFKKMFLAMFRYEHISRI